MNQKDRNLVKALVALVALATSAFALVNQCDALRGDPLRIAGVLVLAYYVGRAAVFGINAARFRARRNTVKAYGRWAVVTGCTGGLGKAFAEGLARRGHSLVLISRSSTKLAALAAELKGTYPEVGVECVAFDFASPPGSAAAIAFYREGGLLDACLDGQKVRGEVGLLVNNVGVGNESPLRIDEVPEGEEEGMLAVNCGALVRMSRKLVPRLAARAAAGDGARGGVLNISSGSSVQPCPYLATYSATKAFIVQYSASVHREWCSRGVDVTVVRPYYISGTGLYASTRPSANAPPPKVVVAGALAALGRAEIAASNPAHGVMAFLFGGLAEDPALGAPLGIVARALGLNGSMLDIMTAARARHDKRQAEGGGNK